VDGPGAGPRTGATILMEGMGGNLWSVLDNDYVDKMPRPWSRYTEYVDII